MARDSSSVFLHLPAVTLRCSVWKWRDSVSHHSTYLHCDAIQHMGLKSIKTFLKRIPGPTDGNKEPVTDPDAFNKLSQLGESVVLEDGE